VTLSLIEAGENLRKPRVFSYLEVARFPIDRTPVVRSNYIVKTARGECVSNLMDRRPGANENDL
jgi:hypothetical protein